MNALLRYAFVKSRRDHLLAAVLLTPLVMVVAPLLGVTVHNIFIGRRAWPLRFDDQTPLPLFATQLSYVLLVVAAITAGAAAFYIFRAEMASRAVGFFVLANRRRAVGAAATVFGAITGLGAYVIALTAVRILTSALPPALWSHLGIAATAVVASAALGAAMVVISPEVTMLVIVYVGAVAIAVTLIQEPALLRFPVAIVVAAILMTTTAYTLRRRCAA